VLEGTLLAVPFQRSDSIYHLALRDEWLQTVNSGVAYRWSTLGKLLDDEGFIHCSFADQVQQIADLLYGGRSDVVLLVIDPSRLTSEVREENLEGGEQLFPHIYGPLPLEAVMDAQDVPVDAAGRLRVERLLDG
jgi:uncharacterized protein (DUF952 family)